MQEALLDQTGIQAELISHKEQLRQQPTVIKIGGSIAGERDTTLRSIAFLREIGIPLVVVHEGGPEIDRTLEERGIPIERKNGLRVTTRETLTVVVEVLDVINRQMVEELGNLGVEAKGFDSNSRSLRAALLDSRLGYVGSTIYYVNQHPLKSCLEQGIVPIIAPIALMQYHPEQLLNTNGDTAAGAVAAALKADLILATDVAGVKGADGVILQQMDSNQYFELSNTGVINGGMMPKIRAGLEVVGIGGRAVICLGRDLLQAFSERPKGTMIVEQAEKLVGGVEKAKLEDAPSIQQLVNHFADKGDMLHRPLKKICEDIRGYYVYRGRAGEVLGCAALQPLWMDLAEIRAVAVREDSQGRGICRALVQACLKEARDLHLPEVSLFTFRQEVFARFGFEAVNAEMKLPQKIWGECPSCPKSPYPDCGEKAMILRLAD